MAKNFKGNQWAKDSSLQRNPHVAISSFLNRNSVGQEEVEWRSQTTEI